MHQPQDQMTSNDPTYLIDDALWSRSLTREEASQLTDQTLDFFYGDQDGNTHVAPLRVTAFTERSKSANGMQQFDLNFIGPDAPMLPSQSYRARHSELGDVVIFISATGQSSEGIAYEACFSHAV